MQFALLGAPQLWSHTHLLTLHAMLVQEVLPHAIIHVGRNDAEHFHHLICSLVTIEMLKNSCSLTQGGQKFIATVNVSVSD